MAKIFFSFVLLSLVTFSCFTITTTKIGGGSSKLQSVSDFKVRNLDDKSVSMSDLTNGKLSVINLWATWCGPCVSEMPHFMELAEANEGKTNFYFLSDEPIEKIKKFIDRKKYKNELFLKLEGAFSEIAISALPTTYILNAEGEILEAHTGSMTKRMLKQKLEKYQAQ